MATLFTNIDVNKLLIGAVETGNNGGKYMRISYNGDQLKNIQLGESVNHTLRCPFGSEPVSQDQPTKLCIKVEASDKLKSFIESIDTSVKAAVKDDALTHRSTLREGSFTTLKLKIMQDTQIFVTTLKDNKITPPKPGTADDIKPNSQVLPIMKIQGGVYFIENNYGTSMVASQILVVDGEQQQQNLSFDFGNDIEICNE
tara:strand:+ start:1769 stop:2368 length:600 start_codon:yes stop_codon:yes gene_type:complete